ncbi:hypothetical protein TPA0907_55700 [Micromonospora humidisoli]|uniref:HNH endonuclease signature motif containing protein n=1 Tax=Micromonospora sp. AKA109 TaxID=2733865 RepID=UPI0022CCAE12|nr:HNH endonuclease signature motif containing protein [Micromonospora sp. AKA109]GHJ11203.1 hypothetical protein TPA0907_55700 [Micromonospora sp. AKA109]
MAKPCLDCDRPCAGTRCEACRLARSRARDRPTARQRGYTTEHERNRAAVLGASTVCWLCGHDGADQADDVIPKSKGGTSAVSNLRPAHGTRPCGTCGVRCNQVRGNADATPPAPPSR